jgi:hypothetical protein
MTGSKEEYSAGAAGSRGQVKTDSVDLAEWSRDEGHLSGPIERKRRNPPTPHSSDSSGLKRLIHISPLPLVVASASYMMAGIPSGLSEASTEALLADLPDRPIPTYDHLPYPEFLVRFPLLSPLCPR